MQPTSWPPTLLRPLPAPSTHDVIVRASPMTKGGTSSVAERTVMPDWHLRRRLDLAGVVELAASSELDGERLRQPALGDHAHRFGHADERRRDQDLEALVTQLAVGRSVLALDVGVDRHLSDLASTGGPDEVDRHRAALAFEQGPGVVGDLDLHHHSSRL